MAMSSRRRPFFRNLPQITGYSLSCRWMKLLFPSLIPWLMTTRSTVWVKMSAGSTNAAGSTRVNVQMSRSIWKTAAPFTGAHNFFVVSGKETFGIFVDYPGILTFDIGYTRYSELKITASDWNLDVYVITGSDVKDIIHQFRQLIGRSFVVPKWAFGYGQSRWSYMSEDEIRDVVKKHRELQIPLDSVYLDIDYMERYKDFTLNNETFPDFADFNKEMKDEHIHLVPIIRRRCEAGRRLSRL